jgi:hypothetical protein
MYVELLDVELLNIVLRFLVGTRLRYGLRLLALKSLI